MAVVVQVKSHDPKWKRVHLTTSRHDARRRNQQPSIMIAINVHKFRLLYFMFFILIIYVLLLYILF